MQILSRFSTLFRGKPGLGHATLHPSTKMTSDDSSDEIDRKLYGMDVRQQVALKRIISMAGQVVPIRQDTIAIDRKYNPYYLYQGKQVTISENPLSFDAQGNAHIIVIDGSNNHLFMTLSDYMLDIYKAN